MDALYTHLNLAASLNTKKASNMQLQREQTCQLLIVLPSCPFPIASSSSSGNMHAARERLRAATYVRVSSLFRFQETDESFPIASGVDIGTCKTTYVTATSCDQHTDTTTVLKRLPELSLKRNCGLGEFRVLACVDVTYDPVQDVSILRHSSIQFQGSAHCLRCCMA